MITEESTRKHSPQSVSSHSATVVSIDATPVSLTGINIIERQQTILQDVNNDM